MQSIRMQSIRMQSIPMHHTQRYPTHLYHTQRYYTQLMCVIPQSRTMSPKEFKTFLRRLKQAWQRDAVQDPEDKDAPAQSDVSSLMDGLSQSGYWDTEAVSEHGGSLPISTDSCNSTSIVLDGIKNHLGVAMEDYAIYPFETSDLSRRQ